MSDFIYQLKVTLQEIEPPIWRRFQVRSGITFAELHNTLQVVMGWWNYHLHLFTIGSLEITDRRTLAELGPIGIPDDTARLLDHINQEGATFTYEYDFGDSWQHEVVLERILPVEEKAIYPCCLAGERACPPEDCGGVFGYEELLDVLGNRQHPEYEQYREWAGGSFDPEAFDLAKVEQQLREGVYWQGKLVMAPLTSRQTFTPQARWFWQRISEPDQVRLLGNVWCSHCQKMTTIINFTGNIQRGDLVLRGECAGCGKSVIRLIEGG